MGLFFHSFSIRLLLPENHLTFLGETPWRFVLSLHPPRSSLKKTTRSRGETQTRRSILSPEILSLALLSISKSFLPKNSSLSSIFTKKKNTNRKKSKSSSTPRTSLKQSFPTVLIRLARWNQTT